MEQPVLTDANQFPSEDVIFKYIGKARPAWLSLFEHIRSNHPDFGEQWRYYRDGKSWLLKVTQKKKTIFWLSIVGGAFRTTFYVTGRAEEPILSSNLSGSLKEQFRSQKSSGRLIGVTVVCKTKKDIEDVKMLIEIKSSLK